MVSSPGSKNNFDFSIPLILIFVQVLEEATGMINGRQGEGIVFSTLSHLAFCRD